MTRPGVAAGLLTQRCDSRAYLIHNLFDCSGTQGKETASGNENVAPVRQTSDTLTSRYHFPGADQETGA